MIIQKVYFTDKPDVVYSLSNEIYTSLIDSEDREIFQQLTIKNVGAQGVEKLIISINKPVVSYDIKKYSETDSVKVVSAKSKFELIYPFLPPNGQIEILIKNTKQGITKSNLEVKHNSGLGKEVFEKSNSMSILFWAPVAFYAVLIVVMLYSSYKDMFTTDIKYNPVDKILKRPKPFLLSSFKWNEFRKEALDNYFDKDRFLLKADDLLCWQVLNSDKPDYLTNDEWKKVLNDASKKFKELFAARVITRNYFILSDEVFSLDKPKQLSTTDWKEIANLISDYYIYYCFTQRRLSWDRDFIEELNKPKPDKIQADADSKYKSIIREIFFSKIVSNLIRFSGSEQLDKKYDISLLDDDQKEQLKTISEGLDGIRTGKQYNMKLHEIIAGGLKESNRDLIAPEDWSRLTELNAKISAIIENEDSAQKDSEKFKRLRERVEKQLDIIDRVLIDPDYLAKIEDYGDTFNSGNLKNLARISTYLKKLEALPGQ